MEGTYYPNPTFPAIESEILNNNNSIIPTNEQQSLPDYPLEKSYIENILRSNKGKKVKIYVNFPNENEKIIFDGTLEQAGKDHIIIKNSNTGKWYLIPTIYLDYIEFDEKINYN